MSENINSNLITVTEAESLILAEGRNYGEEKVSIDQSLNRILAKAIVADRDFPPFDRVTMDGIAIKFTSFQNGNRQFKIQSTQVAGDEKQTLLLDNECIEVMTGTILPSNTDSVIRYEALKIESGFATILEEVKSNQNIHFQGEDRKKGEIIVQPNQLITAAEMAIAASVGAHELSIKKLPQIAIITSGNELVPIETVPELHQIRRSNSYAIASLLAKYEIEAAKIHIDDHLEETIKSIEKALVENDVLILSGGVSMGKKDFIPKALESLGFEKLFHKIAQTPGKPFWFGKKGEKLVFALPGNPVSTYLCTIRYIIPWLCKSLEMREIKIEQAQLSEDFEIKNNLTYFLQVKLFQENATTFAQPIKGHGSGDFANLVDADAFMELPTFERNEFKKGEVFRIWRL
ncbi:MAG: molybdopterin molybdotransferase MoeA [Bacteroidota bacterium]